VIANAIAASFSNNPIRRNNVHGTINIANSALILECSEDSIPAEEARVLRQYSVYITGHAEITPILRRFNSEDKQLLFVAQILLVENNNVDWDDYVAHFMQPIYDDRVLKAANIVP